MIKELYKEYENGLYLGSAEFDYLMLMKVKDIYVKTFKMHDETKFIQTNAFYGCENLKSIVVPNTVESIGDFAFYNCASLKSVVIPKNVSAIGSSAFLSCPNLTIFAEVDEKPDSWVYQEYKKWKSDKTPVKWGYEEKNEHTYTFKTCGFDNIQPIKTKGFIELPKLEREGYLFDGWYENEKFTGTSYKNTYFNKEDITLYAKWIECKEISLSNTVKVDINKEGESKYFKFVPKKSNEYIIKSMGTFDTYAYLFDAKMNKLKNNGGVGSNFEITHDFKEGKEYYIKVEMNEIKQTGSFDIEIIDPNKLD